MDASDDQRDQLDGIIERAVGEVFALGDSHGSHREALIALLQEPVIDRAALEAITRLVLAIVGETDSLAPAAELEAIATLPKGKLEAVPDADHFFGVGLRTISAAISSWLAVHTP